MCAACGLVRPGLDGSLPSRLVLDSFVVCICDKSEEGSLRRL